MPLHPAWLRNISRRVLWAALEADIRNDDRQAMAEFFLGKCAYCESVLDRRWHADHLLSVDSGGFNHVSNRVPACPRCNENEKREMDWLRFLEQKSGDSAAVLDRRRGRIEEWMHVKKAASLPVSEAQRLAWKKEVEILAGTIDAAWKRLKAMKVGQ